MRHNGGGREEALGDAETSQEQQRRRKICRAFRVVVFISSGQGSQRGLGAQLCNLRSMMLRFVATASRSRSGRVESSVLEYLCHWASSE